MSLILVGIFALAGSILLLEIAFTRVLAVMMWHHMTYMVVSVALLGFGAAGSILTARRDALSNDPPAGSLAKYSLGYGASVIVTFFVATRIPIDTLALWTSLWNFAALAMFYAVISVPFIFGGLAIGLGLSRFAKDVGRFYFFDLVGSACGGAISVVLLANLGSSATVMGAAGLGFLAAGAFALTARSQEGNRRPLVPLAAAGAVIALVLCSSFAAGWLSWHVPFAAGKEFSHLKEDANIIRIPSPTAEVEVSSEGQAPQIMGGNFGIVDRRAPLGRFVGQDGTAPTFLYKDAAKLEQFPYLDDAQAGSAHVARQARGATEPDVLVIGVGGGVDVMLALAQGAKHVTAVEVNGAMIDAVTNRFADYLGGLFRPGAHEHSDKISLVHGEGRSFARSTDRKFDVIQLSGVDSYTALSTGAYTVSESYLYTLEAILDFYDALNDDGYINYSRVILGHPKKPRETFRLAYSAVVALESLGVPDAQKHVAVFQGHNWASTIIKKGPFTPPEIEALNAFAAKQGFWGLVFDPLATEVPALHENVPYRERAKQKIRRTIGQGKFPGLAKQPFGGSDGKVLTNAFEKALHGDETGARSDVAALRDGVASDQRQAFDETVDELVFAAAEAGLTEEGHFRQTHADFEKLLRSTGPERDAFLASYPYILSPATDDAPFFFNYYRYGQLFSRPTDLGNIYWPDYPVGHLVLIASLLQITLLAAVLIFAPLRVLWREGIATPNAGRVFLYFAALGVGFMFLEIALMQKMVLFLGHPTYAVSVVLSTLLAAAGTGALISGKIPAVSARVLMALAAAIVVVDLAAVYSMSSLLPDAIGTTFSLRVLIAVAMLAPVGLILGMPFPLGIRILDEEAPQLVPWAWAINGFFSVFASVSCIVLAMSIGFSAVMVLGLGIYLTGLAALITRAS